MVCVEDVFAVTTPTLTLEVIIQQQKGHRTEVAMMEVKVNQRHFSHFPASEQTKQRQTWLAGLLSKGTKREAIDNEATSQSLGHWLTPDNTSHELDKMVENRARELESLPEDVQKYILDFSGDFAFYTVDESGMLVRFELATKPGTTSCLRWMWARRWKEMYLLAHVKIEDMPGRLVQWIRNTPHSR